MPIHVLIAAAAVAGAIPLLVVSVAGVRGRRRESALSAVGEAPVADMHQMALEQSALRRIVLPALRTAGEWVKKLTPTGWLDRLDRKIKLAGVTTTWPLERVLIAKVLLAAFGLGVGLWSGRWLLAGAGALIGFLIPDAALNGRAQDRQDHIQRELSDMIDKIRMSVEAGLAFEGGLARAARAGTGPLAEELIRVLQEIQIGVSRAQALRNLADRSNVQDLRNFVVAVVQSEQYGLPIAQVLRVQSAELRLRRRQRAEERAMKIPVKIIFPLVACIFPSLFIVLLGPAIIRIMRVLQV